MEGVVRGKNDKGVDAYKFERSGGMYQYWTLYATDDRYDNDRAEVKAELAEAIKSGKSRDEAIWDIAKWLEINLNTGFKPLECCE